VYIADTRKELSAIGRKSKIDFFVAPQKFNTDNAAMIGIAAYIQHLREKNLALKAQGNLNLRS